MSLIMFSLGLHGRDTTDFIANWRIEFTIGSNSDFGNLMTTYDKFIEFDFDDKFYNPLSNTTSSHPKLSASDPSYTISIFRDIKKHMAVGLQYEKAGLGTVLGYNEPSNSLMFINFSTTSFTPLFCVGLDWVMDLRVGPSLIWNNAKHSNVEHIRNEDYAIFQFGMYSSFNLRIIRIKRFYVKVGVDWLTTYKSEVGPFSAKNDEQLVISAYEQNFSHLNYFLRISFRLNS